MKKKKKTTVRVIEDIFSREIQLSDARVRHIDSIHPELRNKLTKIKDALKSPDRVIRSIADPQIEMFYQKWGSRGGETKYLCIAVKSELVHHFVLTAYLTDVIKRGRLLWIRKRRP